VGRFEAVAEDNAARIKALREAVPAAHHTEFDALLEEARFINRLRDERGLFADCWAVGIARRAALETGKRLVSRGKLGGEDHGVDLTAEEAEALLLDKGGPSADEITARVTHRTTKSVADCPQFLRAQPAGPPDMAILPKPAQRMAKAVDAVISNLFAESQKESTAKVIHGISVNTGVYEGTARRVDGASDFGRIEQGDVLVTRSTAAYFNVVLPLLGAIVTDRGGQLSHAAIVAREYGIPGIVGTREGTKLIPDGARVRVDGTTGEITVLGT
jgi:phosphohistidine swiveling domain-containing protein